MASQRSADNAAGVGKITGASRSFGFLGRVAEARREALTETDAAIAQQISRKLAEEDAARCKEQLETDEALARELAQRILDEEEKGAKAVEASDASFALTLQAAEADTLVKEIKFISESWRNPAILAKNEAGGGILIDLFLPRLDTSTVRMRFDSKTKEICLTARPDMKPLYDTMARLPEELRAQALAITLDLKVIGKGSLCNDDIAVRYDSKTGKCLVKLKQAFLKDKATSSPLKVQGTWVGESGM